MFDLLALMGLLAAGLVAGAVSSTSEEDEEESEPSTTPEEDEGADAPPADAQTPPRAPGGISGETPVEMEAGSPPKMAEPGGILVLAPDAPLADDDAPVPDPQHDAPRDEQLFGTEADDAIAGGEGDDSLHGGLGRDTLWGGGGADEIRGEDGDDHLDGGAGDDTLYGGGGDDRLTGGPGGDWLSGGNGDDHLTAGGGGSSTLDGDAGDDTLIGNWFDLGDSSINYLNGGTGDDLLQIGVGDIASGGAGADRFAVAADGAEGLTQITDFDPTEDEILVIYDKLGPTPELTFAPGALPDETVLFVDGQPFAEIISARALPLDAVRLVAR